ncbi:hypothetical protein K438DRAFT_1887162, partial [Mycena galopus ATCC 62051]
MNTVKIPFHQFSFLPRHRIHPIDLSTNATSNQNQNRTIPSNSQTNQIHNQNHRTVTGIASNNQYDPPQGLSVL